MIYPMKAQLLKEIEEEIYALKAGITCAPRHVKVRCGNRIQYLEWKAARIRRDRDIEPGHVPACLGHPRWKRWPEA